MFKPRPCGCKGIRTCLVCEEEFGVQTLSLQTESNESQKVYEYCYLCNKAWEEVNSSEKHPNHSGSSIEYPGVLLICDFISEEEETELVEGCDSITWDLSQSGRRKQNFGPKTNFKKTKINGSSFCGFPSFGKNAQDKLRTCKKLQDFQTIEQCAIEYRVETGASIDPHIDDCWVWGERVISLSLLSASFLTMTKFRGPKTKYNLSFVKKDNEKSDHDTFDNPIVKIPMPRRSLLVIYGPARYEWEHSILRSDISDRRICMAYREFTPQYLEGGDQFDTIGKDITNKAKLFW